ncbi:hypothetical protein Tco_0295778 [Tanacetum coccineum]
MIIGMNSMMSSKNLGMKMVYLMKLGIIFANLFVSKMGELNEDGFCNGRELPGMLKKTFKNFHEHDYGLLEKLQDYWWKVNEHECSPFSNWRNYIRGQYANYYSNFLDVMEHEEEERCEVFDDHEWPICYIRRFEMVKYSFRDDEDYVAIKENEYDDLTNTSKEAIHAYQEIFCMMDEGWMDLAAKKSTKLVKYRSSGILLIMEYLVKISKKARNLELKRRHLKIIVLTYNTPYPSRKIRRICAFTSQKTTKETSSIRCLRKKYRLSLKNDMPPRDKLVIVKELSKVVNDTVEDCTKVDECCSMENQKDLPRDIPLDRIEFLRYDTKEVKVRKGIMLTKTELTLEQTQQGVSDEVLVIPMVAADGLGQEVLKIKNFKKDGYSSFQNKEKYEHVSPKVTSSQEGKRLQDDDKRLDLVDDLKEAQDHIQVKLKEQAQA